MHIGSQVIQIELAVSAVVTRPGWKVVAYAGRSRPTHPLEAQRCQGLVSDTVFLPRRCARCLHSIVYCNISTGRHTFEPICELTLQDILLSICL